MDEGDRGDEYTFDPVPESPPIDRPERVRLKLDQRSDLSASLCLDLRYRIPASLTPDRGGRSTRFVNLPVKLRLTLSAGSDRIDVRIDFDNTAQDHRLRAQVRAACPAEHFEVESAFEVTERPIEPAANDFGSNTPAEYPSGATPQRSFATLRGGGVGDLALTVANRGVPEVEPLRDADRSGSLALTLVRAVGWLSRDDLAMRPVHAGPGLKTPGAQCPGSHQAEFSLRWHADDDPRRTAKAHAYANPPLLFGLTGDCQTGSLEDGARLFEVDDPAVVISAIEARPSGPPAIRIWNASGERRRVRIRWNGEGESLSAVRLDGDADTRVALRADDRGGVQLELGPWQLLGLQPGRADPADSADPADPTKSH